MFKSIYKYWYLAMGHKHWEREKRKTPPFDCVEGWATRPKQELGGGDESYDE
jgi:hypothetical protein